MLSAHKYTKICGSPGAGKIKDLSKVTCGTLQCSVHFVLQGEMCWLGQMFVAGASSKISH